MKYIFDFDDTLFDSKRFKTHIFSILQKAGAEVNPEIYYNDFRKENKEQNVPFSLKKFIEYTLKKENLPSRVEELYEEIMKDCPKFVHESVFEAIRNAGSDNCYIVTHGETEFQFEKMARSGIAEVFNPNKVFVAEGKTKKDYIYRICDQNLNEQIVFFDDQEEFFKDLDKERVTNLELVRIEKGGLVKELRRYGFRPENQKLS